MKGECNVARDLMPLCIDKAASPESEAYVDGHVRECEACRVYYEGMKTALPERLRRQAAIEGEAFAKAAARMRRWRVWRRVLAAMLVLAVLAGGVAWYFTYGAIYEKEMPSTWYDVTLSRMESGAVVATMRTNRKIMSSWGGGAKRSADPLSWNLFMNYFVFDHHSDKYVIRVAVCEKPDLFDTISYGRDGTVVWRRGEEIPEASAEMEAYYRAAAELEAFEEETKRRHMIEKAEAGDYNSSFFQLTDEEKEEEERLVIAVRAAKAAVPEWGAGEEGVELLIDDSIRVQTSVERLD